MRRNTGNNLSGQRTIHRNLEIETSSLKTLLSVLYMCSCVLFFFFVLCVFFLKVQGLARATSDLHEMHENLNPPDPFDRGPYFDVSASKNVTALVGKTATLNCRVRNLGDRTVSNESDVGDASHVTRVGARNFIGCQYSIIDCNFSL